MTVDHDVNKNQVKEASPPSTQLEQYENIYERVRPGVPLYPNRFGSCTRNPATKLGIDASAGIHRSQDRPSLRTKPAARDSASKSSKGDNHDIDTIRQSNGNATRLTKHSDLMSILSGPRSSGKSIRSARSIRTRRIRPGNAGMEEVLHEFFTDDTKYTRELRTLVDGVIPVLFSNASSPAGHERAMSPYNASATFGDNENYAKAVLSMGVSLQRLKDHHEGLSAKHTDELWYGPRVQYRCTKTFSEHGGWDFKTWSST